MSLQLSYLYLIIILTAEGVEPGKGNITSTHTVPIKTKYSFKDADLYFNVFHFKIFFMLEMMLSLKCSPSHPPAAVNR